VNGARALIAANVLLVTLAIVLITLDRGPEDTSIDVSLVTTSSIDAAQLSAAIQQLRRRSLTNQSFTLPLPTLPTQTVTLVPATRPKPPIEGVDVISGQQVSLAQFRGKPVFVSVWATWNVGSIAQASTLGRFARAHADEVAVLGIDVEDSAGAAKAFIRRYRMDFPSIADPIGKLGAAWAPVPTTLVFDRRHVLVETIPGSASEENLNSALRVIRP